MAKSRSVKRAPSNRRSGYRRQFCRLRKPEKIFAIVALLAVLTLLFGTLGTVVVDQFINNNGDDVETVTSDDDQAGREFRDAAQANPDDPQVLLALANYLAQTGSLAEAITWYEKALAINPNDAVTRLAFADALAGGGKRSDAELQYKRVFEIQPSNPQAHYGLAELYRLWSPPRIQDAITEYNKTIQVGPDSYVAALAKQKLSSLTGGTPSPVASPATPGGVATP